MSFSDIILSFLSISSTCLWILSVVKSLIISSSNSAAFNLFSKGNNNSVIHSKFDFASFRILISLSICFVSSSSSRFFNRIEILRSIFSIQLFFPKVILSEFAISYKEWASIISPFLLLNTKLHINLLWSKLN